MQSAEQEAPKGLTWAEKVQELQRIPGRIRNICILAHVDHGKTSLSDSLISSNQIISQKLAGTLRYLDSREDEQQRMITMKASSISLLYNNQIQLQAVKKDGVEIQPARTDERQYLVNLMDSPGHVDFSSEVGSALRLSDGAVVLVDVIEGVSPQTQTVIKQAWEERVKTCLVLNKIDRLIVDRDMNAQEIYQHLLQIIEQVNSIMAELISNEFLSAEMAIQTQKEVELDGEDQGQDQAQEYVEDDKIEKRENEILFSPEKGNVAFSSALDCWAFNLTGFSKKIASKMGMNPRALQKFLWGQYYWSTSEKKIKKVAPSIDSKEMFVQFVMDPLVKEYKKHFAEDMVVNSTEYNKARMAIKTQLSKWMPMEKGILGMVVQHLPSPNVAQRNRIGMFCPSLTSEQALRQNRDNQDFMKVKVAVEECHQNEDEPLVAYVTKMQPFSSRLYDIVTRAAEKSIDSQRLIAFARVFSGTLKVGQKVYVMGPKHGFNEEVDVVETTIEHLFLLMGSSLQLVSEVPSGCIVGIGGLEDFVLKTATISNSISCPNFTKTKAISMGIVKVAIESKNLVDMDSLKIGLQKLNRSDPSVEFFVNSQGEYILSTCGEVHLERCLTDLKNDFAPGVEVQVSDPIIAFKETIVNQKLEEKKKKVKGVYEEIDSNSDEEPVVEKTEEEKTVQDLMDEEYKALQEKLNREREFLKKEQKADMYLEKILQIKYYKGKLKILEAHGYEKACATDVTANQKCKIKVRAVGINYEVTKWLEKQSKVINTAYHLISGHLEGEAFEKAIETSLQFAEDFKKILEENQVNKRLVRLILEKTLSFGPKRKGANMIINKFMSKEDSFFYRIQKFSNKEEVKQEQTEEESKRQGRRDQAEESLQQLVNEVLDSHQISSRDLNNSLITGFDMTTLSGPLCEEPMLGACFIVERIELNNQSKQEESSSPSKKKEQDTQKPQVSKYYDNEEEKTGPIDTYGPFTGQLISAVKDLCKRAFLNADPRIVEGMYLCSMQATPETYGRVYGVINKCRGRVTKEEVQEGTNNFLIECLIPVMESFVFNDEIRKKSCGIAYPQLIFYGFEINQDDPFYIPQTEEDLEEHGEGDILPPNPAKVIIEKIRVRKGLPVDKKIVVSAEQQRNLGKNK